MKQAVIVIHGIGDQHPMSTIRSFVDSVIEDEDVNETDAKNENHTSLSKWQKCWQCYLGFKKTDSSPSSKPKFYNKPDKISDLFELRRLSVKRRDIPKTDFYEYYWAHLMKDTQLKHVLSWVWILLWTSPFKIPKRLIRIWLLSLILFGTGIYYFIHAFSHYVTLSNVLGIDLWLGTLAMSVLIVFNYFMLNYLGDAARYFSASPKNVEIRQKIRTEGIKMLRNLHQSNRYDRIVVVGHSLGSVIAYDILKLYWTEVNRKHDKPANFKQAALEDLEKFVKEKLQGNKKVDRTIIEEFQQLQLQLWIEQRKMKNPWLVSDLITVGSPLAHASFLFTKSKRELRRRQIERELPTCPPILEKKGISYQQDFQFNETSIQTIKLLHHAALFGPTRWTNLYFDGDFIGGELGERFGLGIYDIKVRRKWKWRSLLPGSHTQYWEKVDKACYPAKNEGYLSIRALRRAMDLRSEKWLKDSKMF